MIRCVGVGGGGGGGVGGGGGGGGWGGGEELSFQLTPVASLSKVILLTSCMQIRSTDI